MFYFTAKTEPNCSWIFPELLSDVNLHVGLLISPTVQPSFRGSFQHTNWPKSQPVHSKDQPWVFFGRNDAKAETPVLGVCYSSMWRVDSLEKTLMLGGSGGRRKRGWQRMRWLDGITDLMDVRLSELRELVIVREAWRAAIRGAAKSRTRLSNWTELNWKLLNTSTLSSVCPEPIEEANAGLT